MALSPKELVYFLAGISGRNPRLEGCLPKPVLVGSRGRVPFSGVLVVFASAVGRRVLVRLADALGPIDLFDVRRDHRRDEGLPILPLEDPVHHGEVSAVEGLEPADEEGASRHSSSSPTKWPMYGHSSVRNLRQWRHRPSSWTDGIAALTS